MSLRRLYNNTGPLRIAEPSAVIAPLFKCKFGRVRGEVHAPPKGWKWEVVKYFRLVPDPRRPGNFMRVDADRASDQKHLQQCVQAVNAWLAADKRI